VTFDLQQYSHENKLTFKGNNAIDQTGIILPYIRQNINAEMK